MARKLPAHRPKNSEAPLAMIVAPSLKKLGS
jgi:hypothetical protein